MERHDLKLILLAELCREWLNHHSPTEIGNDVAKIRLLKQAAKELELDSTPAPAPVEELYREVFLRSVAQVAVDPT